MRRKITGRLVMIDDIEPGTLVENMKGMKTRAAGWRDFGESTGQGVAQHDFIKPVFPFDFRCKHAEYR